MLSAEFIVVGKISSDTKVSHCYNNVKQTFTFASLFFKLIQKQAMATRKSNQKKGDETLLNLVEVSKQTQSFLDKNRTLVVGGVIGLVVLALGIFLYKSMYADPRQREAVEQMFQAQVQFEKDSFKLALTNPGGGYTGFLDVIENYSGSKAANLSKYYAGICYLHLGEFDAAIAWLEDFNAAGEITPAMKAGALGDAYAEKAYLEKGDYAKAMRLYQDAAKESDNEVIAPYYLKKVGMLHEKNGNLAEAKAAYESIKNDYPNSAAATDIEKYIIRVSGGQ